MSSWPRYRNCKNEVNSQNDSRELKDAESVFSGHLSHVPVNLRYFLFLRIHKDCSAAKEIRSLILEYAWKIGKHFSNVLNSWDVPVAG